MHSTSGHSQQPPAPSRPPDQADTQKKKVSFRNKLLGNQEPAPRRETIDLIGKKLFRIEFEDGDRRRPRCYADDSVLKDLWMPWQHAIIVKLLGKNLGFFAMRDRLKARWKPSGDMDIMDIGHGFFMVKFDLEIDREKVISGGPWMVLDHYVAIRPWTTDFISSQVKINKTLVWIRFPSLGMEYYDESLLLALATAVGTPVKVDMHTLDASRGKFARVCIEIELDKPVVGKVWFRDFWYHVEYEGLHLLCKNCGIYGHVARNCPTTVPRQEKQPIIPSENTRNVNEGGVLEETEAQTMPETANLNKDGPLHAAEIKGEDLYGDWLIVSRKKNQGRNSSAKNQGIISKSMGGLAKKSNNKSLSFSHLSEAGKMLEVGNEVLNLGPQFHPGGGVDITKDNTKVWAKRNKRARGMTTPPKEPISIMKRIPPPKLKEIQPRPTPLQLEWQARVGSSTQPLLVFNSWDSGTSGKDNAFEITNGGEKSSKGDDHLKPPDPNDKVQQHVSSGNGGGVDDEMVVETPPSRQ
jgi:hypothetical protein